MRHENVIHVVSGQKISRKGATIATPNAAPLRRCVKLNIY
jgi:hypothetical protein